MYESFEKQGKNQKMGKEARKREIISFVSFKLVFFVLYCLTCDHRRKLTGMDAEY